MRPSLLLLAAALYRLERLRRFPAAPWVAIYAGMIQISIVAYMTGSLFLNMAYFDLIYHLVGVSVSLELAAAAYVTANSAAVPEEADPWWRRPRPAGGAFPLPASHPAAGAAGAAGIARARGL